MKKHLFLALVSISVVDYAVACHSALDQRALHVVNVPDAQVIEGVTGDVVQLDIQVPLIPAYMNAKFTASSDADADQPRLRNAVVVGESSMFSEYPDGTPPVGVIHKRFYFKLIREAKTVLRIKVKGENLPVKEVKQSVEIREAPRYRCG